MEASSVFCNGADVVFHPVGHVADSHAQGVKFPAGRQGGAGQGAAAVEVGSGVFHYPCHVAYSLVQTAQYGPAEQPGHNRGQQRSHAQAQGQGVHPARNAREGHGHPDDSGRTTRRGLNLGGGVDEVQVECGAAPYGTAPAVVQRAGYFGAVGVHGQFVHLIGGDVRIGQYPARVAHKSQPSARAPGQVVQKGRKGGGVQVGSSVEQGGRHFSLAQSGGPHVFQNIHMHALAAV